MYAEFHDKEKHEVLESGGDHEATDILQGRCCLPSYLLFSVFHETPIFVWIAKTNYIE